MKYSKLKHDIEVMKLNQKHELQLLQMQQENELKKLISSCNHTYEDGSNAKSNGGGQLDSWSVCDVCGKKD